MVLPLKNLRCWWKLWFEVPPARWWVMDEFPSSAWLLYWSSNFSEGKSQTPDSECLSPCRRPLATQWGSMLHTSPHWHLPTEVFWRTDLGSQESCSEPLAYRTGPVSGKKSMHRNKSWWVSATGTKWPSGLPQEWFSITLFSRLLKRPSASFPFLL